MTTESQQILPLGGTLGEVERYFHPQVETLTADELAAVCADAASLGLVTMNEYRCRIGGAGNLKAYARCLVAGQSRDSAWLGAMLDTHGHCSQ